MSALKLKLYIAVMFCNLKCTVGKDDRLGCNHPLQ